MIAYINRRFVATVLFAAMSLNACAQETALSPSTLNANPQAYRDQTITVRGYVTLEPEGHTLYESKELNVKFRNGFDSDNENFRVRDYMKYCLTIANPELMYRNRETLSGKTLTVKGKFLADYRKPNSIDLGACPLSTAIFVDTDDLKRRYGDLLPNP